jgi:hypothetical protein
MESIMARLDRASVSNCMQKGQTGRVSYYVVRGDGVRSDHHPLSCILELAVASPRCSFSKMNSRRLLRTRHMKFGTISHKGLLFSQK